VIDLHRHIALSASPSLVWEALWDVPAVARCLPGCQDVQEQEAGRRYRATVKDRVGPFSVTIPLQVTVQAEPGERDLSVDASGRDSLLGSPVKVSLRLHLDDGPEGGTALRLAGGAEIGGKLAALGQAVIQRKTRDVLDSFATRLADMLRSRAGARPA